MFKREVGKTLSQFHPLSTLIIQFSKMCPIHTKDEYVKLNRVFV